MSGRYALLVGTSEYKDPALTKLIAPPSDVAMLAQLLAEIAEFDSVVTAINERWATIHETIADFFADKKPDDTLLLYYSGHGLVDEWGSLHLLMSDSRRVRLSGSAIPNRFIAEQMDHSLSQRQLLILDCCYSGAFAQGAKATLGATAITEDTFAGSGRARVVLTASSATQIALDGDHVIGEASNSLFTRFLLDGLRTGEADLNDDGWISADEWYQYAYNQVVESGADQKPQIWTSKREGPEILIAKAKKIRSTKYLEYKPSLFVNRSQELAQITNLAGMIAEGEEISRRVLLFRAPHGLGKSWLLREIENRLRRELNKNFVICAVDISTIMASNRSDAQSDGQVFITILNKIAQTIGFPSLASDTPVYELSRIARDMISSALQHHCIFLFDDIDILLSEILEKLERDILSQLVESKKCLLLFAGQHQPVFREFETRLRLEIIELRSFDLPATQKQLSVQVPLAATRAELVQRLSNGIPLANYLYGQSLIGGAPPHDVSLALLRGTAPGDAGDNLIESRSIASTSDSSSLRVDIREWLEALSVLHVFNADIAQIVLQEYFSRDFPSLQVRESIRELTNLDLARWEMKKNDYVLTGSIRAEMEDGLRIKNFDLWKRLNLAAYAYYCKKIQDAGVDTQTRDLFLRSMSYHAFKLESAGIDLPDCDPNS